MYLGTDPITRRQQYLKSSRVETEDLALIELGKLLEQAGEGRAPETGATVAQLLDEYAAVADWEVTTRAANEGVIRRTLKPALGYKRVREVRGPLGRHAAALAARLSLGGLVHPVGTAAA